MTVHPEKCMTVHITNTGNPVHATYQLHGHTLVSSRRKIVWVYIRRDNHGMNIWTKPQQRCIDILDSSDGPKELPTRRYLKYRPIQLQSKIKFIERSERFDCIQTDTNLALYSSRPLKNWTLTTSMRSNRSNTSNANLPDFRSREPGCVNNMFHQLGWEPLRQRRAVSRVVMLDTKSLVSWDPCPRPTRVPFYKQQNT